MTDRNFKPDSGTDLVFEDAGSTDRLRITDGGATILYTEAGTIALAIGTAGQIYSVSWTARTWEASGFSGGLGTSYFGYYMRIGFMIYITGNLAGTSDQNYFRITNLPYVPLDGGSDYQAGFSIGYAENNGSLVGGIGAQIDPATGYLTFAINGNFSGWTASNAKHVVWAGWYRAKTI